MDLAKLEVKVNDNIGFEVCQESRSILFRNYGDGCDMTIAYPNSWSITRALQHAISISQCILHSDNAKII